MSAKKDDPPKKKATYQDLDDLPPNLVGEIVDDYLYASPRPALSHAIAASGLGALLGSAFQFGRDGPGGWWILDEPELHFGPNVVVPDLAGWRRDRLPIVPDLPYLELAPDWLCEVLSPRTRVLDRIRKFPIYASAGVAHAWILDPIERTLEVFRLEEGHWLAVASFEGDRVVRAEPFDAVELDLSLIFSASP